MKMPNSLKKKKKKKKKKRVEAAGRMRPIEAALPGEEQPLGAGKEGTTH
jgi:hypothetical protein